MRDALEDLRLTLATLAEADAIQAKVFFTRDFKAREPIWRSRPGVDLRGARHPLLVQRHRENPEAPEVVPIDLTLSPEQRWLIISGANAGGKTVALKTLGLLVLMAQSGIPIPVAEGSEFCPFDHVYADIGDPQDLQQNLSTFSAHLQRALRMLNSLPGRDLILLDELGTATDPTEGGALALALLQVFYQRGAYGAATTHIPLLKGFAQRTDGFENVAVLFNEETRRPTYRLAYGVVGASNALKIARELGLNPEILAQAERYLDQDELRAYRLLGEVEAAQQEVARRELELAESQRELEAKNRELEAQHRELETERQRLVTEVKRHALDSIKEAETQFKEIVKRLQSGGESWGKLRQEFSREQARLLKDLTPTPPLTPPPVAEYVPGQKVFLPALGLTGEVLARDSRDGRLQVQVRQVKIRVMPEEVAPAGAAARPEKRRLPGPGVSAAPGTGAEPEYHRPPGGRGPAPGGPPHRPGALERRRTRGHHPRRRHRPPQKGGLGAFTPPRRGEGTPRRRQPRGDRGGFEGLTEGRSMHQDLADATFRIECGNSSGSGFSFRQLNIIVTNYHVVNLHHTRNLPAFAITDDNQRISLQLLGFSTEDKYDFAIFRAESPIPNGRHFLVPKIYMPPDTGMDIIFSGFPHGIRDLLVHKAIVSGPFQHIGFYVDGSVNGGNSGGPIVEKKSGNVIGIVTQRRFLGIIELEGLRKEVFQLSKHLKAIEGQGSVAIMGIDFGSFAKMMGQSLIIIDQVLLANANSGIGIGFNIDYVNQEFDRLGLS